jgi:uncharacterized protein
MTASSVILVDSGPLVALFNRNDQHHEWVRQQAAVLKPPFFTCESVISETCFLLRNSKAAIDGLFELFRRKALIVACDLQKESAEVDRLMKRYSNLPMDLADACLVRMAEKDSQAVVFTLDRDFLIYRKNTRSIVPVLLPESIRNKRRKS